MKNISKDKVSVYLFNAYSNLNPDIYFMSGSDKVGLSLIRNENSKVLVIGPKIFQKLLPTDLTFYSSDDFKIKNLYLRYIFRSFKSIAILNYIRKSFLIEKIVSTSDFFPDVIPSFFYSFTAKWYSFTYHLYPIKFTLRDMLGRILQVFSFLLFLRSYKIVTCSSECENFLKKNFRLKNILKISFGLDIDNYKNRVEKNSNLVYLGRIKKSKGVFGLPEIISIVKNKFPEIKLNIIGNGDKEDVDLLLNLINDFGVSSNIRLLHNLSDNKVISCLNESSILLQPSYEEGFGLSVLEALASNMNIALYRLPVYEEHFKDFNLVYTEIGDKKGFAERIIALTSSNQKISYSLKLFDNFSWNGIFSKIFND